MVTTTTKPPEDNCLESWTNLCLLNIKKDIYAYCLRQYTKEEIDCGFDKLDLINMYQTPKDFYINSESFLKKLNKDLEKCKEKNLKRMNSIFTNLFLIVFTILIILSIISYINNNKIIKKGKK